MTRHTDYRNKAEKYTWTCTHKQQLVSPAIDYRRDNASFLVVSRAVDQGPSITRQSPSNAKTSVNPLRTRIRILVPLLTFFRVEWKWLSHCPLGTSSPFLPLARVNPCLLLNPRMGSLSYSLLFVSIVCAMWRMYGTWWTKESSFSISWTPPLLPFLQPSLPAFKFEASLPSIHVSKEY